MNLEPGAIYRFTYRSHIGATPDERIDDYKEVLMLHPDWQGKAHGLDLKRMTAAERAVLELVFSPGAKKKKHGIPLVDDILRRMDPLEECKNPIGFYNKFVRVFIRNKDVYRTYRPGSMQGVTVVKPTAVQGKVMNPKPLFRKIETKSGQNAPQQAGSSQTSRVDLIKQRHQALKGGRNPLFKKV